MPKLPKIEIYRWREEPGGIMGPRSQVSVYLDGHRVDLLTGYTLDEQADSFSKVTLSLVGDVTVTEGKPPTP